MIRIYLAEDEVVNHACRTKTDTDKYIQRILKDLNWIPIKVYIDGVLYWSNVQ
jgi:hypothetical protein